MRGWLLIPFLILTGMTFDFTNPKITLPGLRSLPVPEERVMSPDGTKEYPPFQIVPEERVCMIRGTPNTAQCVQYSSVSVWA